MNTKKIPFYLISLEALHEMASQCQKTIKEKHPDDPLLSSSLTALDEPLKQAALAIGSSQKQALTDEVNAADRLRDRCFIGFKKMVEAAHYNDWKPQGGRCGGYTLADHRKEWGTLA